MAALLTKADAASYLSTTERHLDRLWHERRITAVKVGGKLRFAIKDLDAFIAENRTEAVR